MSDAAQEYSAKAEDGAVRVRRGFFERSALGLKNAPWSARIGMAIVLFYAIVAVFAPVLAPYGEAEVFPVPFAPWGGDHPFGTDQIGRDILSRLIYGARNTIGIALATTFLAFVIGGGLGLMAAISRGE